MKKRRDKKMEVLRKELVGERHTISGNTERGLEMYSRCVRNEMTKIMSDSNYARETFEKLGLYNTDGSFKGDLKE